MPVTSPVMVLNVTSSVVPTAWPISIWPSVIDTPVPAEKAARALSLLKYSWLVPSVRLSVV